MKKIQIILGEEKSGKTTFIFSYLRSIIDVNKNKIAYIDLTKNNKFFNFFNKNFTLYTLYNEEKDVLRQYNCENFLIIEKNLTNDIIEFLNNIFLRIKDSNYEIYIYIVLDKLIHNNKVNLLNNIYEMFSDNANISIIANKVIPSQLNVVFPLLKEQQLYPFLKELIENEHNKPNFLNEKINIKQLEYNEALKIISTYKISPIDYFETYKNDNDIIFEYFKKNFLKGLNVR